MLLKKIYPILPAVVLLIGGGCGEDSLYGVAEETEPSAGLEAPTCESNLDCDFGQTCVAGTCSSDGCGLNCSSAPEPGNTGRPPNGGGGGTNPTPPPANGGTPEILNVGGQWSTEYHLDWSDYLGPLGDLGTPLDILDQILMNNIDLPIISDILEYYIDLYIPQWVSDLVHILNNIVHFFQDVRVEASLQLVHDHAAPELLSGTETWQKASVMIINGCTYGEMDPNYPECALVSARLNEWDAGFGLISSEAHPFTGSIEHGYSGPQLRFDARQVEMEISRFLLFVLDQATKIATEGQYYSLEDAIASAVDCAGLQMSIEDALDADFPFIEAACLSGLDYVMHEFEQSLSDVSVDWEMMKFDQVARGFDTNNDRIADRLGSEPSNMGVFENGEFNVLFDADLDGTWIGVRP